MNNIATDHNQPHHVLLVFQGNADTRRNDPILQDRCHYYQELKEQGKIILLGNFWNQDKTFVIAHVTCAAELEEIISDDPGLNNGIFELVRAMAFTPEQDTITFAMADQYQLDQYA